MKVIVFGASGMVGQGVLRECLLDPGVRRVVSIARRAGSVRHEKLHEIVVPDVGELGSVEGELAGSDACFFCLGVSSLGMDEAKYTRITYDLTLAAARTLAKVSPGSTFVYVSGEGTDSTEKGQRMWARVKGRTENALLALPFKAAYMFRPGFIQPLHGAKPAAGWVRVAYTVLAPLSGLVRTLAPRFSTTTEIVGKAMLEVARHGAGKPHLATADINAVVAGPRTAAAPA